MKLKLYILSCCILLSSICKAQEEDAISLQAKRVVEIKQEKLQECSSKIRKRQERLLSSLRKKEKKFLSKIKRKDSTLHTQVSSQLLSFDSLSRLRKPDSAILVRKNRAGIKSIDSLKAIQAFANSKSDQLGIDNPTNVQALNGLQSDLSYQKYVDDLIGQRTKNLKAASITGKVRGFASLEKKVFYAKEKMSMLKSISEEPTKAEEQAFEYLQGIEGFDGAMGSVSKDGNIKSLSDASSDADLQKMGFRTQQQVEASLKSKFGNGTSGVAQKMGNQVKEFQNKGGDIKNSKKEVKDAVCSAKKAQNDLRNIDKPSFRINPMRGKLFLQRIEKQYNWQTNRASVDKPATLEMSAMVGFKHSPKLTYGIGVAGVVGLGQGWDKIKLTLEGLGIRTFLTWELLYGFGAYGGYERTFKTDVFSKTNQLEGLNSSTHNAPTYSESALLGLTKKYSISEKYNGAIQLLYDAWWNEKGLRSPFVLRFSTQSK